MPQSGEFYESGFYWETVRNYINMVDEAYELKTEAERGNLSSYKRQQLDALEERLEAANTNFRFVVYASKKEKILYENSGSLDEWKNEVYDVGTYSFSYMEYDNNASSDGTYYVSVIKYGVSWPLTAQDDFMSNCVIFDTVKQYMPLALAVSIIFVIGGVILLILLLCSAGRRPGREEVMLNWHDKIPYDLYLAVQVTANALIWGISLVEGIWYLEWNGWDLAGLVWVAATGLGGSILLLALLLTTVSRIKARTIFRNTIIWRLCKLIWKLLKTLWGAVKRSGRALNRALHTLPMLWRVVALFAIYLAGAVITAALLFVGIAFWYYDGWAVLLTLLMIIAIPGWQGFALYLICRWVLQWRKIRAATQSVVAGQTEVQIDTEKYYPDLKEHAEQLNGLGLAIDNAVGERMKSERFKSELITNVSHDLKTPLTSIISYVDLLKKEEISNPTAQEYIEVLDRKSQRLKKLTEDLVEASKASTGALTVTKERLDVVQLLRQALGEYEEKLTNARLLLVTKLPEKPVYINADGRHVWRVLDNLLNNCAKYALEGTRVYLDAVTEERNVAITVKNISRQELNVPPEQLVERFVRGDESRTTEGSGLGLSIARSLIDLQGGQFSLGIDGDLFKAKVILPLADA